MKRSKTSSEQISTQKKTRFVAPEDDPARFEEDVESQLEESKRLKHKGRIKTEGYESDSSDDGEGVVRSRRKEGSGEGGNEEDEDDMFAMGDKEEKDEEVTGKKKKTEYLRLGDIEGQEFNEDEPERAAKGLLESESSESEPEDEDDAERRKKAGMGYELSSFNMREEMEEGKFTEDGMYVRSFDPHAIHDKWLDDADEKAMKKARRAKRAMERKEREKQRAEAREAEQAESKEDMEKELLAILKKGETVLEALARLGGKVKKQKGKEREEKSTRKSHSQTHSTMDVDDSNSHPSNPASTNAKHPHQSPQMSKIERLTTLASELMSLGDIDVYNKTYEQFLRSVRSAGNVEPDWTPPPTMYEYKWDVPGSQPQNGGAENGNATGQVFGPFGEEEMLAWYGAKYFGEFGEKVKVRVVGGEWGDWDDVVD